MSNKFGLGALPPQGMEWQIGKTAATISFVKEADQYLLGKPRISPVVMLQKYVERLKSGEDSLSEWLTVEDYMNSDHIKSMG